MTILPYPPNLVNGPVPIHTDTTLTAQTTIEGNGVYNIDAGTTLTISGPLRAEPYRIFDLSAGGSVTLGPGAVEEYRLEWWGGGVGKDNTAAWNALLNAAPNGAVVTLGQGTYTGTFALPQEPQTIHVRGMGVGVTILQQRSGTEPIINGNPATGQCSKSTIEGVSYKCFAGGSTVPLVDLINARQLRLTDPEYISNGGDALSFIQMGGDAAHSYGNTIDHPVMQGQVGPANVINCLFFNTSDNNANKNTIRNPWFYSNTGTGTFINALASEAVTIDEGLFEASPNYDCIIPGTSTRTRGNRYESCKRSIVPASNANGTTNGCTFEDSWGTAEVIDFPSGTTNNKIIVPWPDAIVSHTTVSPTNVIETANGFKFGLADGLFSLRSTAPGANQWDFGSAGTGSGQAGEGAFYIRNATAATRPLIIDGTAPDLALELAAGAATFAKVVIMPQLAFTGGNRVSFGSGAPSAPGGHAPTVGDIYFRTDTTTTANQRLYICSGVGPTWTGIA